MQYPHSSLLLSSIFFVVLVTVLHIMVIQIRPSARQLKRIDYIWLSFATLSLVGASAAERHLFVNNTLPQANNIVMSDLSVIANEINFAKDYTCQKVWGSDPNADADEQKVFKTREPACKVLQIMQENIKANNSNAEKVIAIVREPLPSGIAAAWDWSYARKLADRLERDFLEKDRLSSAQGNTMLEQISIVFSPYLLAIALAFRFAKVSGELLL